jgi:DNA polymerase-1
MKNIKQHIVLIDISGICYALMHSLGVNNLSYENKNSGIIYAFMLKLRYLTHTLKPSITVFTCDSMVSLRTVFYPEYKAKRNKKKKDDLVLKEMLRLTRPQVHRLEKKILPWLGFTNIFETEGLEGDDIMHRIAKGYKNSQITLVTRDKDMYQTLSEHCSMFDPVTKKLFTIHDLKQQWGCTPEEWAEAKKIAGCTTDEVGGVPGVKETTAIKYLQGRLKPHTKAFQNIENHQHIIKRNTQLVVLPFPGTPKYYIKPNHFDKKRLLKMAKHFNFTSIEHTWREWNLR